MTPIGAIFVCTQHWVSPSNLLFALSHMNTPLAGRRSPRCWYEPSWSCGVPVGCSAMLEMTVVCLIRCQQLYNPLSTHLSRLAMLCRTWNTSPHGQVLLDCRSERNRRTSFCYILQSRQCTRSVHGGRLFLPAATCLGTCSFGSFWVSFLPEGTCLGTCFLIQ